MCMTTQKTEGFPNTLHLRTSGSSLLKQGIASDTYARGARARGAASLLLNWQSKYQGSTLRNNAS